MSKAVEIIDGVLFVHTRHYDDVNRVIICHQEKPYRVFSEDEEKERRRQHGEWKHESYGQYLSAYKCSNCGFHGDKQWISCPYCGADMRKEGEAE